MNEALPWFLLVILIIIWRQLDSIHAVLKQIAGMQRAQLQQAGIKWEEPAEPSEHVRALAQESGSRIAAIKAYRQQTGVGLKQAVAVINKLALDGGSARTDR